ncbi:MAG: replicative DNA helicase [Eubacteriales bacterium]|nr:replicative DNA helicase [Eubacteriales bacterium]
MAAVGNHAEREPNSLEAEQAVLGSILLDNKNLHHAMSRLKVEDFYYPNHQNIYESILRVQEKNAPIDLISLVEDLSTRKLLDRVGGVQVLSDLSNFVSPHNAEYYIDIVAEKSRLRRFIKTFKELQGLAYGEEAATDDLISLAAKRLQEIREGAGDASFSLVGEVIFARYNELYKMFKEAKVPLQHTGYPSLDQKIGGLRKGSLIILAARPGMGKSAFAFNIAQRVASSYAVPTAIFSLEMSKEEVSTRFLSTYATLDSSKVNSAQLSADEWESLAKSSSEFYGTPIYINDRSGIGPQEMLARCRELKLKEPNLGLVIVDYLQLMNSDRRRQDNRQQEISDISRSLKIMARELDCPVIALSQLSRSCEARSNKRPMLSDLRDSGAIEQDADVVLFLYRDDYYAALEGREAETMPQAADQPASFVAELIVAKNRHGETGSIELGWRPEVTLFYELDKRLKGLEAPPF